MSEAAQQLTTEEEDGGALVPIVQGRFGLEVEASNRWRVTVPMTTDRDDLLDESYWQHIATQLRPGDEIVAMPDNMAWKDIYHVCGSGRLYAHVVRMQQFELTPLEAAVHLPSIYKVEFKGSHHKWAVVRGDVPLKDGFETEALARRYAANHESAVTR